MTKQVAVGLDIGGTNTKLALVDSEGMILKKFSFPTDQFALFDKYIDELVGQINSLVQGGNYQIKGLGVGAPNLDPLSGMIGDAPNLPWKNVALISRLEQGLGFTVRCENDANMAAVGERVWGAGRAIDDFVVMTLGTGVGTGVFANGSLVTGDQGLASEGGHIVIRPGGRVCNCGGRGHLETYASVKGIKLTTLEITGRELLFREILELFQSRDSEIVEAVEQTATYLGEGLAVISSLLGPKMIILAGGVANLGPIFVEKVQESLDLNVFPPFRGLTEVVLSPIATTHGAVLGAAALIFQDH